MNVQSPCMHYLPLCVVYHKNCPDSKVRGASMGPIWGRQDPGGPHVGPMNFAIWVGMLGLICGSLVCIILPMQSATSLAPRQSYDWFIAPTTTHTPTHTPTMLFVLLWVRKFLDYHFCICKCWDISETQVFALLIVVLQKSLMYGTLSFSFLYW